MSTRTVALALGAAVLAVGSLSVAQEGTKKKTPDKPGKPAGASEKRMETPKPAPEMAQIKFFDGNWTCEGVALDSPMGPGGKMKSTVRSQTELGGFWQAGTVRATTAGMPPMEGRFHMSYDPGAKQYVLLWVDNMGAYSQETSAGWQGDKMVFAGDVTMGGKKMRARDTFVKAGDGSFKHSWEMQMDGKWRPMGDETCRKSGRAAK